MYQIQTNMPCNILIVQLSQLLFKKKFFTMKCSFWCISKQSQRHCCKPKDHYRFLPPPIDGPRPKFSPQPNAHTRAHTVTPIDQSFKTVQKHKEAWTITELKYFPKPVWFALLFFSKFSFLLTFGRLWLYCVSAYLLFSTLWHFLCSLHWTFPKSGLFLMLPNIRLITALSLFKLGWSNVNRKLKLTNQTLLTFFTQLRMLYYNLRRFCHVILLPV